MSQNQHATIDMQAYEELQSLMSDEQPEFFIELLQGFIEESQEGLDKIQSALAAGDPQGVERPAHSTKSSSAHLGATLMSNLCRLLQEQGRAGDLSQAPPQVEQLAAEFALVKTFVEGKIREIS